MSRLSAAVAYGRRLAGKTVREIPWLRRQLFASVDYAVLSPEEAVRQRSGGWGLRLTAKRQQRAYEGLLEQMRAGAPRVDLAIAAEAVRASGIECPSVLEVGCGGGYYSEVFEHLLGGGFDYLGVDNSPAMVSLARRRYPTRGFDLADGCDLGLPAASFDVVFNGVSLMHILSYEEAIAESRRVARSHCIYHSVPLFDRRPTTYLRKYAYGGLVVEIIFNRSELMRCFARNGLSLVRSWPSIPYDIYPITPEHSHCETFLMRIE